MTRRRKDPVEEEEEEEEQEEEMEQQQQLAEPCEGAELVKLQFDEPLSWRAGKPIVVDQLLKRLDRLSRELGDLDQETTDVSSLTKVAGQLASNQLLHHKDKGVRACAACCIVDILRLCAPNAPFTQTQMKDIFELCVLHILPALFEPSSAYNTQRKYVLQSLAEVKSIVLIFDVEGSDELITLLFSTIFSGVSDAKQSGGQITKDVEFSLRDLLGALIEESESLPHAVLEKIMAQFMWARFAAGSNGKGHHENQATIQREEPGGYQLARWLCQTYPEKMSLYVGKYFNEVIEDATKVLPPRSNGQRDDGSDDEEMPVGPSEADLKELRKSHALIRELWKAAPMILQSVIPQLEHELLTDNAQWRLLATETLGDMIAGIGAAGQPSPPVLNAAAYPLVRLEEDDTVERPVISLLETPLSSVSFPQTHPGTFHSFVQRRKDKVAAVRVAWTNACGYVLSTSAGGIGLSRDDEAVLLQGFTEMLNDVDEKVRLAAVAAIQCFRFQDVVSTLAANGSVSKKGSLLNALGDRVRDKKPAVRVRAMELLGKLWAVGTGEILAGNEAVIQALSDIPTRIISAVFINEPDMNVLLDRVIHEVLIPLDFPPTKKKMKTANGTGQSHLVAASSFDADAVRAERILLFARSLDEQPRRAFFAMQGRQPQMAKAMKAFVACCEEFNGDVIDRDAAAKRKKLSDMIKYLAKMLPEEAKTVHDLRKFARVNDRRSYGLIKHIISKESEFCTVRKALNELNKRIQSIKELASGNSTVLDTLLPLLYRAGCILFNRSHLSTIINYSKTDKDGMGPIAHEILNDISQRNPDLFKAHVGELCKELAAQEPSLNSGNDSAMVETLRACSSYCRRYPNDITINKGFSQTLMAYAQFGMPPRAAKYAVSIILSKKDDRGLVVSADLLQRTMKDWSYGSKNFLNKLHTVAQLELLAPKIMRVKKTDDEILRMAIQEILKVTRASADKTDEGLRWVGDADLDEECQVKCLALKILVNRLRGSEEAFSSNSNSNSSSSSSSRKDADAFKAVAAPTWKLLMTILEKKGELSDASDTPGHHKARLLLLSVQSILKLCAHSKRFDELLSPQQFETVALIAQEKVTEVRHGFIQKLQKYLSKAKLKARFYAPVFLLAYEPAGSFKQRAEVWVQARQQHYKRAGQRVLESVLPRLLSLLAHHPDHPDEKEARVLRLLHDQARYIMFYTGLVANPSNLGELLKYVERTKQTQDALEVGSTKHRVLCDIASAIIRKYQEKKNWVLNVTSERIGLPSGLYMAAASHTEAQRASDTSYMPDGLAKELDDLVRNFDRKKKRTFDSCVDDGDAPPSKKARATVRTSSKKLKGAKFSAKKHTPKKRRDWDAASDDDEDEAECERKWSLAVHESSKRRRSGRATKKSYAERDDDEDEVMEDGAAEELASQNRTDDGSEDAEQNGDAEDDAAEQNGDNDEVAQDTSQPTRARGQKPNLKPAPPRCRPHRSKPAKNQDKKSDKSELSELDSGKVNSELSAADIDTLSEPEAPPPPKLRATRDQKAAAPKSMTRAKPSASPAPAAKTKRAASKVKLPARATRSKSRAGADPFEMAMSG